MSTKSTLLSLAISGLCAMNLAAQIPNSGFENWTSGEPDGWLTDNVQGVATPVTQTAPGHSGSSALKGQVAPGIVTISPWISSTDSAGNGFPVSQAHSSLSFYYQLNVTNSALAVTIYLEDAGGNAVGGGGMIISTAASSFTLVTIPITYIGSDPVECIISATLTDTVSGTPNVGDYFIIDDLTFGGTAGVESPEPITVTVFPNPTGSHAAIDLEHAGTKPAELFVTDIQGRVVFKASATSFARGPEWVISVADMPTGVYALRVVADNRQWLSKLVVAR